MISFKETLNESKREIYEEDRALKVFKEIDKSKKQDVMIDEEGLEQRIIMTKQGMYIVYFNYNNIPMTIIKNPSRKDMINFKAAIKPN